MRIRLLASLAVAALSAVPLSAHDFWLGAAPWTPAAGAAVTVTANVGEHFPKATNYTAPDRVELWRVIGAGGDVPVARTFRRDGESLAADVTLPSPGAYLAVMTIQARVADMKGPAFTKYLQEEGLDEIVAARQAAGEAEKTAKERYARYSKVAVRNGAGSGAHLTRPAGLKAEFVPSTDPTSLHAGQSLTLQLLTAGKPVSGAAITALSDAEGVQVKGRTDANGRVTLKLDRDGAWLIRTVHMDKVPQAGSQGSGSPTEQQSG